MKKLIKAICIFLPVMLLTSCASIKDPFSEIKQENYNLGYEAGKSAGYDEGYSDGLKAGKDNGFKEGAEFGFDNGFNFAISNPPEISQSKYALAKLNSKYGIEYPKSEYAQEPVDLYKPVVYAPPKEYLYAYSALNDIAAEPVDSSALSYIGYSKKYRTLLVAFRESGDRYLYFDVPEEEYNSLAMTVSKGRYYDYLIKGRYPSFRIDR